MSTLVLRAALSLAPALVWTGAMSARWQASVAASRADAGETTARSGPDSHPDYAPAGMPDFSQCRGSWGRAGQPGQWTHAGPVAVTDAFWWLDSVLEPGNTAPPAVADGFPLITAYPRFGPPHDDHARENLTPVVEDLARRMNTEGALRHDNARGTPWEDLVQGATSYVEGRGLGDRLAVATSEGLNAQWLAERLEARAAVVALLGVWETQGDQLRRVGGHYAAVAGFESAARRLTLSDPLADRGGRPGGRWEPPDPTVHSCREAPGAHDDAGVVSHDAYALVDATLPHGGPVLGGYFEAQTMGEAAAFAGQNDAGFLAPYTGEWRRGEVAMAVDAVVAIVPADGGVPSPTPVATATPTPEVAASATATASNTATPSVTPVPTSDLSPPGRVTMPAPSKPRAWLPVTLAKR